MLQERSAMKWSDNADYSTYQLNHQRFPAVRVQICERSSCCTRPHQSEAGTSSYHHHQNQTDGNIPGQQEDHCSCLRWLSGAAVTSPSKEFGGTDGWMKSLWSKLLFLHDWLLSLSTIWWTDKETTGPIRKHMQLRQFLSLEYKRQTGWDELQVEQVGRCWARCESIPINTSTRTDDEDRIFVFSPEFSLEWASVLRSVKKVSPPTVQCDWCVLLMGVVTTGISVLDVLLCDMWLSAMWNP